MTDKAPEDTVRDQLGAMFLSAVKDRESVIRELLQGMFAAETMMRGLPKIVDAMDELAEVLRTPPRVPDDVPLPDIIRTALQAGINDSARRGRTIVGSIRAVARTQANLARLAKHTGMLLMTYASSDTFLADASKLASRFGKGDEALRAMFKAKFGEEPLP